MMTAAQIAEKLGGLVAGGNAGAQITGVSGLAGAGSGDVSFVANTKYAAAAERTKAGALIVGEEWKGTCAAAVIRVKSVEKAMLEVAALFAPPPIQPVTGIHPTAVVSGSAGLGKDVGIGPYCVIEPGVRIGDRTVVCAGCYIGHETVIGCDGKIYPQVSIRERTRIGDRVIIHSGAVIGSDGYGFLPEMKDGKLTVRKIPQTGVVDIGDDVEIGANVTIDRARFGRTRIGNSVKIDNLVHIAHNVTVGDCSGIIAQVGISGSSTIGSRVILYGQAGVAGHVSVGDGAVVGAQAGVTKDVPPGVYVSDYPAMPHKKAAEAHANLMRLPHLKQKVADLEKRIADLEKQTGPAGRTPRAAGKRAKRR